MELRLEGYIGMQCRVEKLGFQTVGFQTGMLCVLLLGRSCPRCINGQQVGHLGWVHGFGVKKSLNVKFGF